MQAFSSIEEAFKWWLDNIYPNLPPEKKKGKLTYAWRNYTHSKSLSQEKMSDILEANGFKINIKVVYDP